MSSTFSISLYVGMIAMFFKIIVIINNKEQLRVVALYNVFVIRLVVCFLMISEKFCQANIC